MQRDYMKVLEQWRFPSSVCGPRGVRLVFLREEPADGLLHDHIVTKDIIGPC